MKRRIPFLSPTFPEVGEVAADYAAIVQRGIFSNAGPLERRFAGALDEWIGGEVRTSLVASGTAGIELAIGATFNSSRSYVLVASFTFAAGPLAIRRSGYRPVFLDIDPRSWQPSLIDAETFLAAHEESTAGILLTNTFGVANENIEAWESLASRYQLALVIDSAAGFGSQYESGERLGARGTCEVFSLHATKTLAVGEGGVVSSRDHELISRLDRMKNFGFDESRDAVELGTNAKLPELACALGLRSLAALPDRLAIRRNILGHYRREGETGGLEFQPSAQVSALPFISALMPSPDLREAVLGHLEAAGIEARAYYNPPVHQQRIFSSEKLANGEVPMTLDMASRVISLPMSDDLTSAEVSRIVAGCLEVTGVESIHTR